MRLITGPGTPRTVKATEVEKGNALLVPADQAKKAKAKANAKATLKANPKVCILYMLFDLSYLDSVNQSFWNM